MNNMTKLAVISDLHGNLLALEAVMEDIINKNIQVVINLGTKKGTCNLRKAKIKTFIFFPAAFFIVYQIIIAITEGKCPNLISR